MNDNRIGIVATSRSGSTFVRRKICHVYGLEDSNSWLQKNEYKNIRRFEESYCLPPQPYILKILVNYIPEKDFDFILNDMSIIWLWRKDVVRQFISHVVRLHTKVNHLFEGDEQPQLDDESITVERGHFDNFVYRQNLFWKAWETYGVIKEEPLIKFEDFMTNTEAHIERLQDWNWKSEFYGFNKLRKFAFEPWERNQLPHKIEMNYKKKFTNYDEILKWFKEEKTLLDRVNE